MDGIEIVGAQHHAATSPFLLSSPPPGHHPHHHHHHSHTNPHDTYNIQTVQLSFDACLAYNTVTTNSLTNRTSSQNSSTNVNISHSSAKAAIPLLTLSSYPPFYLSPLTSPELNEQQRHEHSHHHHSQNHLVSRVQCQNPSSPSESAANSSIIHSDDKTVSLEICRHNAQDIQEKDKPGELNTPVTTSSDLPSFFGPAALLEPPAISGTDITIKLCKYCRFVNTRCFVVVIYKKVNVIVHVVTY